MDKDRNETTKRILHFTLEILHLLTGEDYTIVKKTWGECVAPSSHLHESGGRSRARGNIMEPPPHSLIHEKKILELIHRITELLTREVPIRCQDVAVYFSMEEWEYVEGHKDLYQDIVMMEDHRPLTSQDGVIDRNPPERCPRPLYSQDCPEGNVPEKHQGGDLTNNKVEDEEERMRGHHPCMREVKEEIPGGVTPENPIKNPERKVMLSLNDKGEDGEIMERPSGEDGEIMERSSGQDGEIMERPSGEDGEIMERSSGEDGEIMERSSGQDGEIMERSSGEDLLTPNVHPDLSYNNPPDYGEPSPHQSHIVITRTEENGEKGFHCDECGKYFQKILGLIKHKQSHERMKPYLCSECGKCFTDKPTLVRHARIHTGEKPYSCSECGKRFTDRSHLITHRRIHTGENLHSCSECGKCCLTKSHLVIHKRSHTGERPYTCSECGKNYTQKSHLVMHERSHTGEKPYSCSECGKCFSYKSHLVTHMRLHTGEMPFSCSECGKCFSDKANFGKHVRSHTGVKPYSCSECGKCFMKKTNFVKHERSHTGN
ncbi:oocyte zinc finger protein XlCOF7.1-like [Hyla sarda]|uniref:oocyte zinc finger protein XlCOF7.1-like n=1 Tax=Hyla sarda TaxID=327740 RepID=UPI0024C2B118|nr:oocyte zinc finger protein XlCOF7.1-like [Hyla sarda]XP_056406858.1 oocyte zinc finger protein XlCOF7.1-like [Hyla sarda]XP_056406859.1 oocyte zinc finger protein XlCOF7.1-like [Hyla sarda]